jgi:hypothetical protein
MRLRRSFAVALLCPLLQGLGSSPAPAQTAPWSGPVRGSWVQTGPAGPGDVTLAAGGRGAEIVVGRGENAAVCQAAEFLAGDIERISGYRPALVEAPSTGRVSIRLVTLGNSQLPAGVETPCW